MYKSKNVRKNSPRMYRVEVLTYGDVQGGDREPKPVGTFSTDRQAIEYAEGWIRNDGSKLDARIIKVYSGTYYDSEFYEEECIYEYDYYGEEYVVVEIENDIDTVIGYDLARDSAESILKHNISRGCYDNVDEDDPVEVVAIWKLIDWEDETSEEHEVLFTDGHWRRYNNWGGRY